jgi:general stress protein 26
MSKENLFSQEAVQKMKEMIMSIDFTMFTTALDSKPMHIIPMSTRKVDNTGSIWFMSYKESEHNQNISKDPRTQYLFRPSAMQFLTVYGEAAVITDKAVVKRCIKQ